MITQDGRTLSLASVLKTERFDGTYNLTVADLETYFVGEQRVLVHNCKTLNRIARQINKGKAPRGVTRLDKGNELDPPHIHFSDGRALYRDGTWKHNPLAMLGGPKANQLTNAQRKWLNNNNWNVPE